MKEKEEYDEEKEKVYEEEENGGEEVEDDHHHDYDHVGAAEMYIHILKDSSLVGNCFLFLLGTSLEILLECCDCRVRTLPGR